MAGADLALLAVPDDVLPGLVRGLAAAGSFRPGQIVVHTSGSHGITVLAPPPSTACCRWPCIP